MDARRALRSRPHIKERAETLEQYFTRAHLLHLNSNLRPSSSIFLQLGLSHLSSRILRFISATIDPFFLSPSAAPDAGVTASPPRSSIELSNLELPRTRVTEPCSLLGLCDFLSLGSGLRGGLEEGCSARTSVGLFGPCWVILNGEKAEQLSPASSLILDTLTILSSVARSRTDAERDKTGDCSNADPVVTDPAFSSPTPGSRAGACKERRPTLTSSRRARRQAHKAKGIRALAAGSAPCSWAMRCVMRPKCCSRISQTRARAKTRMLLPRPSRCC
jgi:hypothetical protein